MEYFRPDVKVGAFIFVALVLLVIAALTIGGVGDWFAPTQQYTVLLSNANLLRRRAKVSYAGSPVGEVTAITVHSQRRMATGPSRLSGGHNHCRA